LSGRNTALGKYRHVEIQASRKTALGEMRLWKYGVNQPRIQSLTCGRYARPGTSPGRAPATRQRQ
ncbi:MAG TPA: hypothetical protein VJ960_02830, partial [Oceanipulchritudo sp.]|nr:hypothetical protein [Oceanipulchritudo sp.]